MRKFHARHARLVRWGMWALCACIVAVVVGKFSPRSMRANDAAPPVLVAAQQAPQLPVDAPAVTLAANPLPPSRRVRLIEIDPLWLDAKRSPFFDLRAVDTVVALPLWEDTVLPVRLRSSEVLGRGRHLVRGEIDGVPGSRFLLTIADGAVAFSVYLGAGPRFLGVPTDDGRVTICELDTEALPPCGGARVPVLDADATLAAANRNAGDPPPAAASAPQTTAQIDVLMVYTPEVLASATPTSALVARADLAIAEANSDYARSETRVVLRRVGLAQVSYTETGNNATALDRVRQTSDGFMDTVHALRDQLGADLVCLIVQRADPTSIGIAYILSQQNDRFNDLYGFSVVQNIALIGASTFSHEIGHNLGCAHDRENAGSPGVFSYSYGYRFSGGDGRTYRTIMAYQPGNALAYFSNPRLTAPPPAAAPLGIAIGLPGEADNATSINRACLEVASYRVNKLDPPARGQFVNVSTRAFVGTGDSVLIGGFVVGSPGPKPLIVRALGPTLAQFGVSGALANPQLTLVRQSDGLAIASNTDWSLNSNVAAITATGYAPTDGREPALHISLDAGAYTVLVSGEASATGVALVEVYEVTRSDPKLINLSTRGYVSVGDQVMIGGLVVTGNAGETKRILVRTLGPTLANFGVPTPLDDPAIVLYNQTGDPLIGNDDWDALTDTQQNIIRSLGLAPGNRRESALLLDLPPGAYTVILRPFENTSGPQPGIGLIEAYEITAP